VAKPENPKEENVRYLGDGVYGRFEWGKIKLSLDDAETQHIIFINQDTLKSLIRFAKWNGYR